MVIKIIYTELIKLKRYSILLIGFLLAITSPLLTIYQYSFSETEFTVQDFVNDTVWNNTILFFPLIVIIIGGYLINREYTDRTLKNILSVPIGIRTLFIGKIMTTLLLAMFFGICNFFFVILLSVIFKFTNLSFNVMVLAVKQIVGMSIFSTLAVVPIIIYCAKKPNMYLAGTAVTFVYAYAGSFLTGRNLQSYYPITAGLGLINYSGQTGSKIITYNREIEITTMFLIVLISIILLFFLNKNEAVKKNITI